MYNPQLSTFITVAVNGSFTKAADELYMTPTAVMKQINALEERLRSRSKTLSAHCKKYLCNRITQYRI